MDAIFTDVLVMVEHTEWQGLRVPLLHATSVHTGRILYQLRSMQITSVVVALEKRRLKRLFGWKLAIPK